MIGVLWSCVAPIWDYARLWHRQMEKKYVICDTSAICEKNYHICKNELQMLKKVYNKCNNHAPTKVTTPYVQTRLDIPRPSITQSWGTGGKAELFNSASGTRTDNASDALPTEPARPPGHLVKRICRSEKFEVPDFFRPIIRPTRIVGRL